MSGAQNLKPRNYTACLISIIMCNVIRGDLVRVRLVVKKFSEYHTEKNLDLDTGFTFCIV
jgi:hypothetical protein